MIAQNMPLHINKKETRTIEQIYNSDIKTIWQDGKYVDIISINKKYSLDRFSIVDTRNKFLSGNVTIRTNLGDLRMMDLMQGTKFHKRLNGIDIKVGKYNPNLSRISRMVEGILYDIKIDSDVLKVNGYTVVYEEKRS